ncbi:phage holin family protein [Erythrobacter sp. R86502]|uniref:phage holin family protein n=1 Tax=Erythrobacter sp. R86502 TaxID=3093846 RepID=UPI0036D23ABA
MYDTQPSTLGTSDHDLNDPTLPPTDDFSDEDNSSAFSSLRADVGALTEDARTYAEAEFAFQKTRAVMAGKKSGRVIGLLVLALVLLHIALIALAVGVVIALAPYITIWGAIAVVVGAMLIGVAVLVMMAQREGKVVSAMFVSGEAA